MMVMSQYQAILFDLDGTLLPMDLDEFTGFYFQLLAKRLPQYEPQAVVAAVWQGTKAMMTNDGSMTNEDRFWSVFSELMGADVVNEKDNLENFYRTDFHRVKAVCGENALAGQVVALAHRKADKVILATNPLFPPVAVESRLSWIGLSPADFDYITTYDNSSCCKPAKAYYEAICRENQLDPSRCLMVGNDLKEDAFGASQLGMRVHIVTDSLIEHGLQLNDYSSSSFAELLHIL